MQYINPVELLGLTDATDGSSIDNEIVKKTKRKLFADIDLSDKGVFEYYGLQLAKGDCEKAIDQLNNNEYKEFYLYLANHKPLNEFLVTGKDKLFEYFKHDSIFKLPEFLKFISPYYAPRFDKALLIACENNNINLTKSILNTSFLITSSDLNTAFRSVSNTIQNRITEIDEITKAIKNEESAYNEDDIEEVVQLVKEHFPSQTLNCLPQYFNSQILKIANSINYLSNSIWDAFDSTQVPNDLTEYLLTLNIGGLERPTFEKNFKIIKKKNDERIEQAKNAPSVRKWAKVLINLRNIADEVDIKKLTPKSAFNSISAVSIGELNKLPSFATEIRTSIAHVLRGVSISMWNTHKDIGTAIKTIKIALSINIPADDLSKLNSDLLKLKEILKHKDEIGEQIKSAPKLSTTNGIGTTIYGKTVYFVILFIPILPLARYNCEFTNAGYRFYGKLRLHTWQKSWRLGLIAAFFLLLAIATADSFKSSSDNFITTEIDTSPAFVNDGSNSTDSLINSVPQTAYKYQPPVESKYIGNQLKDGSSPLTGCFGKALYNGNATLTIKNGGDSDAIICLYSIDNNRTIRNEYVRKNSRFTMSNITQGEYKIRVFYGNNWNPEVENNCGTKGNFESDINFSEFDGTEYFEDSSTGYTNATITLYTVEGGNASSSSIDGSKFFSR